jgi:hypothetical protein
MSTIVDSLLSEVKNVEFKNLNRWIWWRKDETSVLRLRRNHPTLNTSLYRLLSQRTFKVMR